MKEKVKKFNKDNINFLPVSTLFWDFRNTNEAILTKTVSSDFYNTNQRVVSKFYKSISPINL